VSKKRAVEVLAVVPARGGSKSIPRKNIQHFSGHPLIAYSIAAGLQAKAVNRVIVSTDDEQIAEIADSYGAEVPFLRPEELALDDTPDWPVFKHALDWLSDNENYQPDFVVQLRPTSPLRPPDCVDRGVKMMIDHPEADSLRGVVPSGQNPYKMWRISDYGQLQPLLVEEFDEPYNMPRQKLPPTYWQTGHIDVIRVSTILEKKSMTGETILPLVLDPAYTIDIDTIRDLSRAEWMLSQGDLPIVLPGKKPRPLPEEIKLVVLDFDGVLTDNRVWVDAGGREMVAAHRGDGWGIARLKEHGIEVVVLSTETNPVVSARCQKLGIEAFQSVDEKGSAVEKIMEIHEVEPGETVFLGNDVNDLPCFEKVGWAAVVGDAHPSVKRHADYVLSEKGGQGAVRELCDLIIGTSIGDIHDQ
jgi:YrbI family 3-deoxy-D-manno-octulosonate 8-phosphate phosphatase